MGQVGPQRRGQVGTGKHEEKGHTEGGKVEGKRRGRDDNKEPLTVCDDKYLPRPGLAKGLPHCSLEDLEEERVANVA